MYTPPIYTSTPAVRDRNGDLDEVTITGKRLVAGGVMRGQRRQQWEPEDTDTEESSEEEYEMRKLPVKLDQAHMHQMRTGRSLYKRYKGEDEPMCVTQDQQVPTGMYPLIATGQNQRKYVPWGRTDLEALIKRLPPIANGAASWITTFERETCQDQLALADIRTILIKVHADRALMEAERVAKSEGRPEDEHFNAYRNQIWGSLRRSYPTAYTVDALTSLQIKESENTHEYLVRAWEMWEKGTGERPDNSALAQIHFRKGVVEGLPQPVQNKLKDTVGLDVLPQNVWVQHVEHGLKRHRKAEKDKKESQGNKTGDKLVEQLTKAVEQATIKAAAQAILAPAPSVMAPALTPAAPPPLSNKPPVQYASQPLPMQSYPRRDVSQIRCYTCGFYGHYARQCGAVAPSYPRNPQYGEQGPAHGPPMPQNRGRGSNGGGYRAPQGGRGRGNQNRGGWQQGPNMQGVSAGPVPDGYDEWAYHNGDGY